MQYPSEKADSLERYVRKTFPLPRKSLHLYSAMRWLEMNKKAKFCGQVFAGYREISDEAGIDITSVKPALQALQMAGLMEVVIGSPIKKQKRATFIRRKTLVEIKTQSTQGDGDAYRLAAALSKMAFRFGDKIIKACWTVGRTGRVCSSKPNIQGERSDDRLTGLKAGLEDGDALVHADIKQAEPSIIKHLLTIPQERDLYREYMDATHCYRDQAKKAINSLAYCRDSLACFKHWPEGAKAVLGDYVQRLTAYKEKLFSESRKARSVTTITGRVIVAGKGDRLHAGRVMNWRVQGTVADIVNAACLRLVDSAIAIVPLHDAVYVLLPKDKTDLVEEAITEKAREIGLSMNVKTEVHHAG